MWGKLPQQRALQRELEQADLQGRGTHSEGIRPCHPPLGKETDYEYDDRNFLVSILQPDPDCAGALARPESEYGYDAVGNQTSIGQGAYFSTPLTHGYNAANRRTSTSQTVN